MSNTTSDCLFAARVFAVFSGTLVGAGLGPFIYFWRQPPHPDHGIGMVMLFFMALGVVAMLGGCILGFTSMAMRRAHRVGHLFGWVFSPALLAFGDCWMLVRHYS